MKRGGGGRRRSNGSGGIERSGKRSFKGLNAMIASEFVKVPTDLKGHVIGKKGNVIEGIRKESGARVVTDGDQEGFTIIGTEEQRACARRLINQKLEEVQKRHLKEEASNNHLILIPKEYIGLVIGSGGDTLRSISTKTGARLVIRDERWLYAQGSDTGVEQAELQIRHLVAGARLKRSGVKRTCFIDDWNLPDGCELKLIPVRGKEHVVLPGSKLQYRLKATEEYELTATGSRGDTLHFQPELRQCVMNTLCDIKQQMKSNGSLRGDMWCHFGIVVIREPDEDDIDEAWSTKNAEQKVNQWKVAFKEGVDLDESFLTDVFGDEDPKEYVARHDFAFITPSCYSVRCKVWIARKGLEGNLEEIPIPFFDIKNVVQRINFNDDATKSRCRGWLVLPSRKHFQADIIFPGCEFDFRITIRTETTDAPSEEETRLLSSYLSKLMMSDDNEANLHLPQEKLPEGFHFIHRRCSHRTVYTPREGFAVMVSKEKTWSTDGIKEERRETTDLHLHCDEWDRALHGEDWEPEEIVDKLPGFLDFVQQVQELLIDGTKRKQ